MSNTLIVLGINVFFFLSLFFAWKGKGLLTFGFFACWAIGMYVYKVI